jgi:hypothetical membrane protein
MFSAITSRVDKTWRPIYNSVKKSIVAFVVIKVMNFFKLWNVHTLLAIAGIIGPIFWLVGDLFASLNSPGYSLVENSISSLALTNIGWLQTIGFLALGLLVEIFAAGLLFNVKSTRGFYPGIAIFVIFGFAMLLIGAFRTDASGTAETARTIEGRIHGLTAQTAFTLFPVALLFLLPSIKKDPNWKCLNRYTLITCILSVVLIILIKILSEPNPAFGILERLVVINMILWVDVSAVNLFIISLKRKSRIQQQSVLTATNEDF